MDVTISHCSIANGSQVKNGDNVDQNPAYELPKYYELPHDYEEPLPPGPLDNDNEYVDMTLNNNGCASMPATLID